MNKDELLEMIKQEVSSLAFEALRDKSKEKEDKKNKIFKPKGLSEEEIEHSLFYGGSKPDENGLPQPITIKEGYDTGIPQINAVEITEFEGSFDEMLKEIDGASVVFDPQSNGYSLKMWIGPEGIEAGASGVIEMGDAGSVKFAYSLKNGVTISTEDLSVEQGNKRLLEKLYNHYDTWQKDWREKLTIQPGQEISEPEMPAEQEAGMPDESEMGGAEEIPAV